MNSDTISKLFINIYLNESPSITFENIAAKNDGVLFSNNIVIFVIIKI